MRKKNQRYFVLCKDKIQTVGTGVSTINIDRSYSRDSDRNRIHLVGITDYSDCSTMTIPGESGCFPLIKYYY